MKTSLCKFLCLLLLITYSLGASAYRSRNYWRNDNIHTIHAGVVGGMTFDIFPLNCASNILIGATGALSFDYIYYRSLRNIDLGVRTGCDLGYHYVQDVFFFGDGFTNIDYLGNEMQYTTAGYLDVQQNQFVASIPIMFAMRTNGFVCNAGVRLQAALYQSGTQSITNPQIDVYYPAYGVQVNNELITGLLQEDQLSMPQAKVPVTLECWAGLEMGYEYAINKQRALGVMAYCDLRVWNSLPKKELANVIQVSPITDSQNPIPTVTVNDVANTLQVWRVPMQFGVKLYYAFTL